jgi:hypothetical protein
VPRGDHERREIKEGHADGANEPPGVGGELTAQARWEGSAEKRGIGIEVRLELVVKVALTAERQGSDDDEESGGQPPPQAAPARGEQQKTAPKQRTLEDGDGVTKRVTRRPNREALRTPHQVGRDDENRRQEKEGWREADSKTGKTTQRGDLVAETYAF